MIRRTAASMTIALLAGHSLAAAVIPGRWDKVAALAQGTAVVVRLDSGDRLAVDFEELTIVELKVRDESGARLSFPKPAVAEVFVESQDPNTNGTLIGTAVGFGTGFGATVAFEKSVTASGFRLEEENLSLAILGGLIGAGAGALTGWALDRSTKEKDILYAAP